jgi:hypothetical protein
MVPTALVVDLLVGLVGLVPLLAPAESPPPVMPPDASSGFAYATLLGGFFGLGLLVLLWVLLNLKPKRQQPYSGPND